MVARAVRRRRGRRVEMQRQGSPPGYAWAIFDRIFARWCEWARGEWRGSQVVRQRSAKPLFAGSIPARASGCSIETLNVGQR